MSSGTRGQTDGRVKVVSLRAGVWSVIPLHLEFGQSLRTAQVDRVNEASGWGPKPKLPFLMPGMFSP